MKTGAYGYRKITELLHVEGWRVGYKVLKIDVNDPSGSIAFNPMDDVVLDIAANNPRALSRVKGIALQLLPDPQGGGGANAVFYQGGRTVLSTVQLAVCVVMPKEQQTLTMVNRAINDMDILHDLLDAASKSKALNGEIADAARSLHQLAFGDEAHIKQFLAVRSKTTLNWLTSYLGEYTEVVSSCSMGRDEPHESLSRASRKVLLQTQMRLVSLSGLSG